MSASQEAENRRLNDPMPSKLEEIRAELDYWEVHLYDGEVNSNWWLQVQARIDGLRHRENRLIAAVPPVSITNNAIGPNSRFNQNSVDRSTNQVSGAISGADWERLADQFFGSCRFLRADSQWTSSTGTEAWRIAGGQDRMCEALLQKAGAMLLKSPNVCGQLSREVASEPDSMTRWLLYLKQKGFHKTDFFGHEELDDGTKVTHVMGGIRDLSGNSAATCMECAALET